MTSSITQMMSCFSFSKSSSRCLSRTFSSSSSTLGSSPLTTAVTTSARYVSASASARVLLRLEVPVVHYLAEARPRVG